MQNIKVKTKIHKDKREKVLDGPFSFLKWIFKVEAIILLIILVVLGSFKLIPEKTKFSIKYNIEKTFISNAKNNTYNYGGIKEALDKNKYINEDDKKFIDTVMKNEIQENISYIDMNKVTKRIENLQVCYYENKYNVAGSYNSIFNKINIYNNENREIFLHELNHVISNGLIFTNDLNIKINKKQNNLLSELTNELFTREYYADFMEENINQGYEDYMMYIYGIAELLPKETLLKFKFDNNESILISGLLEIDDNIDEVYDLINSINTYTTQELEKENCQKIHDGFAYFYEKKYKKNMADDIEFLLYFYNTPIQTKEERLKIENYLDMKKTDYIIKIIPRGYISEKYKNEHKEIQVEYIKNGKKEVKKIS